MKIIEAGRFRSSVFFTAEQTYLRRVVKWELEYYDGGGGFSVINGIKYPHSGAHFILARPGDERFSIGSFDCLYVHFTVDEPLAELLESVPTYISSFESSDRDRIPEIVAAHNSGDMLRMLGIFLLLLSSLKSLSEKSCSIEASTEPHMKQILAAKEHIDRCYASKITLDDLAAIAYLSKNFFRTTFSRILEVSPTVYLRRVRVLHALELLRTTELGLAEIAQHCGFESQSYMNYVLRRETGKTPSELRKFHRSIT